MSDETRQAAIDAHIQDDAFARFLGAAVTICCFRVATAGLFPVMECFSSVFFQEHPSRYL